MNFSKIERLYLHCKLRMPSGNESGVNELWLPGGKLPNGKLEAVIDPTPISNIRVNKVIN